MTDSPRNNAAKTRGRPFAKGNPGRRKGARHRATVAAEALLDGEAEALTRPRSATQTERQSRSRNWLNALIESMSPCGSRKARPRVTGEWWSA
jgi:hypothetical protein